MTLARRAGEPVGCHFPRLSQHRSAPVGAEQSTGRGLSTADWSGQLPSRGFAADSVAVRACHPSRSAAPAPSAVPRGDARNARSRATIPGGSASAAPPAWSTMCGGVTPRHSAAASFFTRSTNAVFSRPLKPRVCNALLSAARVPQRMTCVTRTSFRRREVFSPGRTAARRRPATGVPGAPRLRPSAQNGQ